MENLKYFIPKSVKEALTYRNDYDTQIVAGGTDLMAVNYSKSGLLPKFKTNLLFLSNLDELNYIKEDESTVYIGATCKYNSILNSPLVSKFLKDVISDLASPNIRNMATLAGNIANASPAGDGIIPLVLLDAKLRLSSLNNERFILVKDFIYGVRKIHLNKDEIISEIIIPKYNGITKYKKVGSRNAESISKVSLAIGYKIENKIVKDFKVAIGCVNIIPVRNKDIENKYIGLTIDEFKNKIEDILSDYAKIISPITDQRSTKEYKFKVTMNILRNFIESME